MPSFPESKITYTTQNQAEAAGGWKYLTTTSGDTKARNLTLKMGAGTLLALVAKGVGGSNTATGAVGGISAISNEILGTDKVIYYKDKIYERKTPVGAEWQHNITFYQDKAKTKKLVATKSFKKHIQKISKRNSNMLFKTAV
ncbi:hypothetical protein EON06_05610 [Staphylococcus delphini]|uniref:hypothetical protein n=1 Tax=Staphylococcus delphini TaxID=53344 RepID=UPI0013636FBA|nr:hypothetical protein [Staphylococcus delphini]NBK47235.1 hypothetical protein [Staphylococcus delphini]